MHIDKEIIRQRKAVYGDNFLPICDRWNSLLGTNLKPSDVAMMMALLKETRIAHIKESLQRLKENPMFLEDKSLQFKCKRLTDSLEDSIKDKANYLFIATNFEEYKKL
jgi:hypothetical protein